MNVKMPDITDSEYQDEYYNDNITKFYGIDGNKPYKRNLNNRFHMSSSNICGRRFFLHPFKFGKYYGTDYIFDSLRFVDFESNEHLLVPIDVLIQNDIKKSNRCLTGQMGEKVFISPIHKHLNYIYKNATPYISIREILEEAVNIIGNKQIYFKCHPGLYHNCSSSQYNDEYGTCERTTNTLWKSCQYDIYECLFAHIK